MLIMNNKEKVYSLYLAIDDLVVSICNVINGRTDLEKIDYNKLFNQFITKGERLYSDLHYDLVCEMGLTYTKAEQEFGKIASGINKTLGQLENDQYVYYVYILWFTFSCGLNYYRERCMTQPEPGNEFDNRLNAAYQKYLFLSESNSESWQNLNTTIQSSSKFLNKFM